jgi:hypothetical protein
VQISPLPHTFVDPQEHLLVASVPGSHTAKHSLLVARQYRSVALFEQVMVPHAQVVPVDAAPFATFPVRLPHEE